MTTNQLSTTNQALSRLEDSLFAPDKCEHYENLACKLAGSQVIPKQYIGKPTDLFVAMAMGYQLGMPVEQAIQDIAVINGRPCVWGDGLLAIVMNHPEFDDIIEAPIISGQTIVGYSCTVKRKGKADYTKTFTLDMAKKAGLLGKTGPWTQYPDRMLQMRARGFALRDRFPDALRGIKLREEVEDYIDGEIIPEKTVTNGLSRTQQLKQDIKQRQGVVNADNSDLITDIAHEDDYLPAEEMQADAPDIRTDVAAGMPDNRADDNAAYITSATQAQLEIIMGLFKAKELTPERIEKAFDYFCISDLKELSEDNADKFIAMLHK
jgi:hypothetical protein